MDDARPTLRHEPDPSVGAWINERLGEFGATVTGLVPRGYPAYARILHRLEVCEFPALPEGRLFPRPEDVAWRRARWSEAAAANGTVLHPLAQSWRLLRRREPWEHDDQWTSPIGELDPEQLPTLLDVLGRHTEGGPGGESVLGLWEGRGWIEGGGAVSMLMTSAGEHPGEPAVGATSREAPGHPAAFPTDVLAAPRLELPHRAYLLFRGPLAAVLPECTTGTMGRWQATPNLLWPIDRSWFVATEIDLDSTVVGGSRALVDELLAHPDLETFEVGVDDSLMFDGDHVNT